MLSVETNDADQAPPSCDNDAGDESKANSAREKPNKCSCDSCGKLIAHILHDEEGRHLSPRQQSVFNRLYRHRLTKELHHRKLAAEQITKEARECTYMPLTNNARREVTSTSSLTSIAHRERLVEEARDKFNQGKLCVECLKKVEISTGTFVLDDEMFANEGLMTQSLPNVPLIRKEDSSSLLPKQIVIETKSTPKSERRHSDTILRPPTPTRSRRLPEAQEESRNDEAPMARKSLSMKVERESYGSFAQHPPSEIILYGKNEKKAEKGILNRFGFPAPSPTKKDIPKAENRNDEEPGIQKTPLPPRAPTPTQTAFSFDAVSNMSTAASSEKPIDVRKVETLDSHTTPILRNVQVEEREQVLVCGSSSNASTVSSDIPLRRDSYVSIDVSPSETPVMPLMTPHSVPFDEKTQDSQSDDNNETEKFATSDDHRLEDKVEQERDNAASPPKSPTSPKSETSMRSTSILDREDSFSGPNFVTVAPTEEGEKEKVVEHDWIGQVTECVACDDTGAAKPTSETNFTSNESVVDEEEKAERKAADQAYASCEVEAAELDCIDLRDDNNDSDPSVVGINTNESLAEKNDDKANEEASGEVENTKEDWLENATEWAKYNKSASPIGDNDGESKKQELAMAPSDEGFINSDGQNKSGSSDFFGRCRTSADKSTECSTVALTEASHTSHNNGHWYGTFQRGTSEGEVDEFLDRVTDCVTCWKLIPWPESSQGEEQP